MTQFLTAVLRTVIPSLWGSLITWLVLLLPVLSPLQAYLLGLSETVTAVLTSVVTAVVIGAWYALWRWLQPRLPDWLVQAFLGSAKIPVYPGKHSASNTASIQIQGTSDVDPEAIAKAIERRDTFGTGI